MKGIGGHDYPGGHKGSLYNGVNNSTKSTNYSSKNIESSTKSDRKDCWPVGPTDMLCPTGKKCPEGMISNSKNPENNKCTNTSIPGLSDKKDSFNSLSRTFPDCWSNDIKDSNTLISARGSGISAGDSYTSYNIKGYPTGVSFNGGYSFGSDGSTNYIKCEECGEKHEIEKKIEKKIEIDVTKYDWTGWTPITWTRFHQHAGEINPRWLTSFTLQEGSTDNMYHSYRGSVTYDIITGKPYGMFNSGFEHHL